MRAYYVAYRSKINDARHIWETLAVSEDGALAAFQRQDGASWCEVLLVCEVEPALIPLAA